MSLPPDQGDRPPDLGSILQSAVALHQQGYLAEAERSYRQILAIAPQQFDALQLLGTIKIQQGHHAEGADLITRALRINPNSARALLNLGFALLSLDRADEAAASFDQALALNPGYVQALYGRGSALAKLHRPREALIDLDRALALKPDDSEALIVRGHVLKELSRYEESLASYDRALALKPDHGEALVKRGNVLFDLKRHEQALTSYDRALAINPDDAEAHNSRGAVLHELKRSEEALASFEKAVATEPDHPHAFGGALGAAMVICDWTKKAKLAGELEAQIIERKSFIPPFMLLGCSGNPSLQLQCAKNFIQDKIPARPAPLYKGAVWHHDRIRIAYLSADFHRHATAYLITELFELHERSRFEVLGVSFGPDDGSTMRTRVTGAFDQFHDVRSRSDREVAELLNELQVDIAVDLKGFTTDCRPGILAHRPAPIQVNYLGYPGTMGADFIDYVVADKVVLPCDQQLFFTEKIVHLPDCYQVNDSKRKIAAQMPQRRDAGLPEQGFVFCCFNNNHKITAPVFDVWMRILRKVEGSVLWLLRDNHSAERNLHMEAAARGVDPARLVFADRLNLDEHLARHRLADLFLDTIPFNAHTTASDALWAGLPLLTCRGESFAGRVAASLLHAIGLPELVTNGLEDYEALALKLAIDPPLLKTVRLKLEQNRLRNPLFDTDRFRRHIEAAYTIMWRLWQLGDGPRSLVVAAIK